jgi:hypothetical protein
MVAACRWPRAGAVTERIDLKSIIYRVDQRAAAPTSSARLLSIQQISFAQIGVSPSALRS